MTSAWDLAATTTASVIHCPPLPMVWCGTSTAWDGPPGQGNEINTNTFRCTCGAELVVTLTMPS